MRAHWHTLHLVRDDTGSAMEEEVDDSGWRLGAPGQQCEGGLHAHELGMRETRTVPVSVAEGCGRFIFSQAASMLPP
jgi:hypothetical protein